MNPKLIDLRPNRILLDPNFDGYKLSLEEIPKVIEDLDITVDRTKPNEDQYSLLHAKLYGLHNHLLGESSTEYDSVYFIDSKRHVNKMYIDPFSSSLFERYQLWEIPANREKKLGDYNVSLHFASDTIAVLSDGCGILHIIDTGKRDEHNEWKVLFSDEVLGKDKCFIVKDAICTQRTDESDRRLLHCLLLTIEQANDKFNTVINWITLRECSDNSWTATALRKIQGNADLQYCSLEKNCQAIYTVSEKQFRFVEDSENPVVLEESTKVEAAEAKKTYVWCQTSEDVTIKFKVPALFDKHLFSLHCTETELAVKYDSKTLIDGKLSKRVDATLSTWSSDKQTIDVCLFKSGAEQGDSTMWSEVIEGDASGEMMVDGALVEEVHERLAHLCSDTEVTTEACGTTFNSQQVEECDYADTKSSQFARIDGATHRVTHSADLGAHHVLLSVQLAPDAPPALAVRHDVDACVWQPHGQNDTFGLKHEGTLLAFGYVQASKQQRKFSACSPDLSYSVICETSRHLFLYRQNKAMTNGELRHRTSGRRVGTIAQQQVVSIADQEVLGIYAAPSNLYILTDSTLFALKM